MVLGLWISGDFVVRIVGGNLEILDFKIEFRNSSIWEVLPDQ